MALLREVSLQCRCSRRLSGLTTGLPFLQGCLFLVLPLGLVDLVTPSLPRKSGRLNPCRTVVAFPFMSFVFTSQYVKSNFYILQNVMIDLQSPAHLRPNTSILTRNARYPSTPSRPWFPLENHSQNLLFSLFIVVKKLCA